MRKVVYTCIVGGYDELRQPEVVDGRYDYICFTDDISEKKMGVWEIRPIPYRNDNATRLSRYVKILPHNALEEYDVSVWVDANITITGQGFYEAVEKMAASGSLVAQVPHIERDCVYDEIAQCYKDLRIGFKDALGRIRRLKSEGYPRHFGLMENNVIFRRHNDPKVIGISEKWWEEYMAGSTRDQFCLMPVYWREGYNPEPLLGPGVNVRNSDCLRIFKHPSVERILEIKGIRRLPWKFKWTWRKIVSALFF